jgi:hypothetical protein
MQGKTTLRKAKQSIANYSNAEQQCKTNRSYAKQRNTKQSKTNLNNKLNQA